MRNLFILLFLSASMVSGNAQKFFWQKKKPEVKKEMAAPPKPAAQGDLKPYKDVITKDAISRTGFFKVHHVKDKYYFEIPDSIYGRDILAVNRISKAPVNRNRQLSGYGADQIGEDVVRFEMGADNKVYLRSVSYIEEASDTTNMYLSVQNSNVQPIIAAFPIAAFYTDSVKKSKNAVIDVTAFINSDNSALSFSQSMKRRTGLGNLFADRSFIDTMRVYPQNIEIRTVKTYAQTPPQGYPQTMAQYYPNGPITYELNTSILLLPEKPMKARLFDPRVGYFAVSYTDFDANSQGIERRAKITRWRLEPKPEDLERYLAGELVEPQKPIVIYIDPATPKKWVPYLIAGVNDWQKAFEKAGFKNAIYALEAPQDSTWSLDDARHSAIVYKASDIANASGPHVHDPRSGEILETHINWYHNVMNLLHNWYMIQASPSDKGARKPVFDDELMGQLIRFVSSHEVGHTLGLRHNFGSSATIPVEKLRDKAWVEANGHTPSIMDYARFNYVAQPEDNIGQSGIFPRIGVYDEWAIEWGYRYRPEFAKPEDEIAFNNKLIIDKLNSDKRFTFGTESDPDDPRNQNEDLGDNAILAGTYGIKNLKFIMPNVIAWTKEDNKNYSNAENLYTQIATQFSRYAGHVAKNVGGIYRTPVTVEQSTNSEEFVPAKIQREAVQFLNSQVFATPEWLIDKTLIEKAEVNPISTIDRIQKQIIDRLISRSTIDKLVRNESFNGREAYTADEMFRDLKKGVWSELSSGKDIDVYRRNLQKNYVAALIALVNPQQNAPAGFAPTGSSDAAGLARVQLMDLRSAVKSAAASATGLKRSHLVDIAAQIDKALDPK
ncbi:MAG: zinc-dependent metalloprotease [Dysgonamonadaceae bacterium]|jgi:hypothetical protein|nr:zinc-dependent metalloprotease [Dysgonamonadaceae bacterium]